MRQIENFIAGEFVAAASGQRFDKHSPVDNRIICSVSEAGRSEVDAAVSAARNYSKNIYAKLGIKGQTDLVRLLCRSSLLLRL
ncbi:2-hydroxymuconic semialdehyde dehydrogenase [compost metagenome]